MITGVRLAYESSSTLNGAFTYLQTYHKRTDINNGIVKINASSVNGDINTPVVKRDLGSCYWYSNNENGSWYEVDFLKNKFYLEGYFIRAHPQDYFANWQVLGSYDGENYDVVDEVSNYTRPSSFDNYFKCKYPKQRRIFKILTNGTRFYGNYTFYLYRLEFYGRLTTLNNNRCTRARRCKDNDYFAYFLIIAISNANK